MKPELVILRHPEKLGNEAVCNIRESMSCLLPGVKTMVLCEGMQAWLLGDDGQVYDLNNSGKLLDGRYRVLNEGEQLEPV